MFRVVVSAANAEDLQRVLAENNIDADIELAQPDTIAQVLAELSRLPADTLLVDADTKVAETAIQRYKLARPDVRIILFAPGREPGDAQVARIVASQVWDVVTDLDRIPVVLLKPAGYHDMLRWISPNVVDPQKATEKLKVVIRRMASTTRPVVIVVNSYRSAAGCTTLAVSVAAFLSHRGHKVALIETACGWNACGWNQEVLGLFVDGSRRLTEAQWQPGLKVWTLDDPAQIRQIIQRREHEYIVIDDGQTFSALLHDLADLKLIAVPDCSWYLRDLVIFRKEVCGRQLPSGATVDYSDLTLVVSGTGRPGTKVGFKGAADRGDEYPVTYLGDVDLDDGLRVIAETVTPCLSAILEPYLPDQAPQRPWYRKLRFPTRKRRRSTKPTGSVSEAAATRKVSAGSVARSVGSSVASAGYFVWFWVQMLLPWLAMAFVGWLAWTVMPHEGRAALAALWSSLLARLGLAR